MWSLFLKQYLELNLAPFSYTLSSLYQPTNIDSIARTKNVNILTISN